MATVNDIFNEINRIENAKTEIGEAITEKGVDVPAGTPIQGYPALVRSIPTAISELFWCTYGTTPAADIVAALGANKLPIVTHNGRSYIFHSEENGTLYFVTILSAVSYWVSVDESNDAWADSNVTLQDTADKTNDISGNRTSEMKYPNTKGVFDLMGKWGVVSQTMTEQGNRVDGYEIVASNPVYGLIPQSFIDRVQNYHSSYNISELPKFNEETGYFELNGLTNIAYDEMVRIFNYGDFFRFYQSGDMCIYNANINGKYCAVRTLLPTTISKYVVESFIRLSGFVTLRISFQDYIVLRTANVNYAFYNEMNFLREIRDEIRIFGSGSFANTCFRYCPRLESLKINRLSTNITLQECKSLSLASVVYMVTNAGNTTAITITLHATAYARCQADTTEYTYNGQTYTGVIAYAAAKNITIASA